MATTNPEASILDLNTGANRPWLRELADEMGHDLSKAPLRYSGVVIDEEIAAALDTIAERGPGHGSPLE